MATIKKNSNGTVTISDSSGASYTVNQSQMSSSAKQSLGIGSNSGGSSSNANLTNQNSRYTDWNMVAQGHSPDIAYTSTPNSSTGKYTAGSTLDASATGGKNWGTISDSTGSYKTSGALGSVGLSNTYSPVSYNNSSNLYGSVNNPTNTNPFSNTQTKFPNTFANSNGYLFGTQAEQAEKNTPGYLDSRNTELATLLSDQGITDIGGIKNYLSQYEGYATYDERGQNNTAQSIYNKMMSLQSGNQEQQQETPMTGQFWDTVGSILKNAYGIDDLDTFKDMYGSENYYSLLNGLKDVEGTWNATDPANRSQLEGKLQEILAGGVGMGVDQSKLNLNLEAVLSKFDDASRKQVEADVLAVQNLSTKGYSLQEIANETGMSKGQVTELVNLAQGLPSQIGKYYDLNLKAEDEITEEYDMARNNLQENYDFNMKKINQELDQLKQDYNNAYLQQQEQNEQTLHNMDLIAGMTGTGYSRRGLEGMSYAQQQANQVLNDLLENYDRGNLDIANSIEQLTTAYRQNDENLVYQMNQAITNAKNNYIAQVSNIQQKYGLVGLEGQQAIASAVSGFIAQAEQIYQNSFDRAWTNTNNLINAVSNLGAIEQQQLQTKQMKIASFQQDSMYMTQSQISDYCRQNGLEGQYQQFLGYQQDATINTLNSISMGLGNMYQGQVQKLLSQGYTPAQAVNQILNSSEVQSQLAGTSADWSISGDYMYNKSTGEVRSLSEAMSGGYGQTSADVTQQIVSGLQNFLTGKSEGDKGGQCGAFANNYLQSLGLSKVFVDPIDKKKAVINSNTPTVGSVVVMDSPNADTKQYGHVAIVTGIDYDKGTMDLVWSNNKGDLKIHTSTHKINASDIYGYYDPAKVMGGSSNGNMGGSNVSNYDVNTLTMRIGRTAYGVNISYEESKRVESVIRDGFAKGKDETGILRDVMGYSIDPKHQAMGNAIMNILQSNGTEKGLSDYDMVGLARQINQGNYGNAISSLEKQVANKTGNKDMLDKETLAKIASTQGDSLIKKIQDNMNKLGIVEGNANKRKRKLANDKEGQQIASQMVALVTDWRKSMAGSAMTETELKMIDDLMPSIKDNPYNAITKIEEFQSYMLNNLNQTRSLMNLPSLNNSTLNDLSQRANLYLSGNSGTKKTNIFTSPVSTYLNMMSSGLGIMK